PLTPVQQDLTAPERVEEYGHRADIQCLRPQPELMADDPLDLRHDGAQELSPLRHRNVHQLLDRATIGEVVVHRADIIQPVRVGDELMVGAIFRQLLYPSMQKSHDRRGLDNPLSFQFQNYFQDAVSARVLRAHVEEQLLSPKGWQSRTLRMS